ncbi:MAG: hypothetical protein E7369_00380 [Clostridiales bacterium]|nr:hypothetical protein [Clostridiales bacterium]
MKEIYGYKESDLLGLADYLRERGASNLTKTFSDYARLIGKARGTVRNMYYALIKSCSCDKALAEKYLHGLNLRVEKIVEFTDEETENLIVKILEGVKCGESVRSVVNRLANGDMKVALRYQNKYRSVMKSNPKLLKRIADRVNASQVISNRTDGLYAKVTDAQMSKLKREIDALIEKISYKTKKENQLLRERIRFLEIENYNLTTALNGKKTEAVLRLIKSGQKIVN